MPSARLADAAAALGVSVDTIRRRIKRGELVATQEPDGRWLVEIPEAAAPAEDPVATAELAHAQQMLCAVQAERDRLDALVDDLHRRLDAADAARQREADALHDAMQRHADAEHELRVLLGQEQQRALAAQQMLTRLLPPPPDDPPTTAGRPPDATPHPWWQVWRRG